MSGWGGNNGRTGESKYEQVNTKGEWDKYSFESNDAPEPELAASLQALAIDVVEISELTHVDPLLRSGTARTGILANF